MSAFVYFVQAGGATGPVKIGFTQNMAKRLESLQNGCPEPLRILGAFDYGEVEHARAAEAMFHDLFSEERRRRSEWFDWTDSIKTLVDGLLEIQRTFGPTSSGLTVDFDIVRKGDTGEILFRPRRKAVAS